MRAAGSGTAHDLVVISIGLSLLLLGTGCQRKPRFVPAQIDSTATAVDSMTVHRRQAQDRWESEGPGDEAAGASARVVAEALATRPPEMWKDRTEALLDSLGIGAETALASCGLAVNFFARSDPSAGAWPYLFWCADGGVRYQSIDGRGLHLFHLVTRALDENRVSSARKTGPAPGVAAIFGSRASSGQQPLLMVWQGGSGNSDWRLVQTLGADSLGGVGEAAFETPTDSIDLVARTFRTPPQFSECATCPHVYWIHRFRWGDSGFSRIEDSPVPSTYATFVQFIQALTANHSEIAARLVTDPSLIEAAQRLEWGASKGPWRVAPATDENPESLVLFRGQQEAYRVQFEPRGPDWVIAGFVPIPRTVE